MLSELEAKQLAARSPDKQYGNHATFVPIDENWGYKYFDDYNSQEKAYAVYEAQKRAYKFGLAPAVGELFTTGFITQRADALSDNHGAWISNEFQEEMNLLEEKLIKLFGTTFGHFDLSARNVGYLDGKLVCIDFSIVHPARSDFMPMSDEAFQKELEKEVVSPAEA